MGSALIDGEVVVAFKDGKPDFSTLQEALSAGRGDLSFFLRSTCWSRTARIWPSSCKLERKERLRTLLPAPTSACCFPSMCWARARNCSRRCATADLKQHLADLGLTNWPLLSGGKGVHVVVPLTPQAEWSARGGSSSTIRATSGGVRRCCPMWHARGAPVAAPVGWTELRDVDSTQIYDVRDTATLIEPANGRALRRPTPLFDAVTIAARWLADYRAATPATDVLYAVGLDDTASWTNRSKRRRRSSATAFDEAELAEIGNRLATLSDAIARRYFLQGAKPLRAAGLVLA